MQVRQHFVTKAKHALRENATGRFRQRPGARPRTRQAVHGRARRRPPAVRDAPEAESDAHRQAAGFADLTSRRRGS